MQRIVRFATDLQSELSGLSLKHRFQKEETDALKCQPGIAAEIERRNALGKDGFQVDIAKSEWSRITDGRSLRTEDGYKILAAVAKVAKAHNFTPLTQNELLKFGSKLPQYFPIADGHAFLVPHSPSGESEKLIVGIGPDPGNLQYVLLHVVRLPQ